MNRRTAAHVLAPALAAALMATTIGSAHAALGLGPTQLVSTNAQGDPADSYSLRPLLSATGNEVAFVTKATNLVAGDTNASADVFVKDTSDGSVERVSVDEVGAELAGSSHLWSVSADGQYVLFVNYEPTGDAASSGAVPRLRLADRTTGTSRALDLRDRAGELLRLGYGAQLSGNGRYLVFGTDARLLRRDRDGHTDLYRFDLTTGALRLLTPAPVDDSGRPGAALGAVSHSGRVVAFLSQERLLRRDRVEYRSDVYVRDLRHRRPRLASVSSSGVQARKGASQANLSANGRYVLFTSRTANLVRRDTNRKQDVFVHDRRSGRTHRVSVNSRERQGNLHSGHERAWISNDGRHVVFDSQATNLAPHTTDFVDPESDGSNIFVRDRRSGTTTAVTMAPDGTGADGTSGHATLSRDGSAVAFFSYASNLVDGADPGVGVFLRRLQSSSR